MRHRRIHLLEKFQVQLSTAAALAVVYFSVYPLLRPWDPQGPLAFVAMGNFTGAVVLTAVVLVLAGAAALVTISSRPESALVAALIGAGGLSLRCASVRALLWHHNGALPALYGKFILEVLWLGIVTLLAAAAIDIIRGLVLAFKPNWLWRNPLAGAAKSPGEKSGESKSGQPRRLGEADADWDRAFLLIGLFPGLLRHLLARSGAAVQQPASKPAGGRRRWTQSVSCLLACLLISIVLLTVLLKSPDRGQIIFALLIGFMISGLISHQLFPSAFSITVWIVPTIAAVVYYALAANAVGTALQSWMHVPHFGHTLPIDWLTAGTGGAVLGYWMSARIQEVRHFEARTKPSQ